MSIIQDLFSVKKLRTRPARVKAQQSSYPGWALGQAEGERWNLADGSQHDAQIGLYRRVTWVNSGLEIYSALCAATALNVMKVNGQDEKDIPNHPFEMLLDNPNELQSRFEFMQATFAFLRLVGNCYWWINPMTTGEPAEIWVMLPNCMTPIPDGNLFLSGYEYKPGNGQTYTIPVEQVVHFKSFNPSSLFVGLGKGEPLYTTAETDTQMVRYNANLFGKNNAKIEGALAFKDFVANPEWDKLKLEVKTQWGGTNRNGPLLLRGAGTGVNWIAMASTQQEMQFLESRNMSREEIWAVLAPGLASMLSVNATEANAKTGKQTLTDLAMWPAMVSVAQRITKSILPLYGPNLRAEFEDIRITDRALAIQEIDQYAKFHTLGEVRKDKFKSPLLGDERDKLLVAQVKPEPATPVTLDVAPGIINQTTPTIDQPGIDTPAPGTRSTKANPVHDGVMVALYMPDNVTKQIVSNKPSFPSGSEVLSPDEMHVTLAYLGEIEKLKYSQEELISKISELATSFHGPLTGTINGMGKFFTSHIDGMGVVYLNFDAPELPDLRQELVSLLDRS
jgi:HK97 family phage portal protein